MRERAVWAESAECCPLCSGREITAYWQDRRRDYWQCQRCQLVHVAPSQRLASDAERAEYDLHHNDSADEGYRRFLGRLAEPLLARMSPNSEGLDFGCGPGPTLSKMLEEAGHRIALYDHFYYPDRSVLLRDYDLITASEVAEHLFEPGAVLQQLWSQLRPGGWLGVMTKRVIDREAFGRWHYKNDPTHVCFFADASFRYLATQWGAELTLIGADVALLHKPNSTGRDEQNSAPSPHQSIEGK